MNSIYAFDPEQVIADTSSEAYEILFDAGEQIFPWDGEAFCEAGQGNMYISVFLQEDVVKEYSKAYENAKNMVKPGILYLMPNIN